MKQQRLAEMEAMRAMEQRRQLDVLGQKQWEERARAEENFQKARQAVDEMLTALAGNTLAQTPRAQAVQKKLLESVAKFYDHLSRSRADDPALVEKTGRAQVQLGELEQRLGHREAADASYRAALALFQKLVRKEPNHAAYRADLARTQDRLGNLLQSTGRLAKAEASYRLSLALWEKLVTESPGTPEYRVALADVYQDLGRLLKATGKQPQAEVMLRKAQAIRERLLRE